MSTKGPNLVYRMQLSVTEAATVLGKSPRQIRYMIQQGQLKAERQGKSWRIDGNSLPLGNLARKALSERVAVARETLDAALEPAIKAVQSENADSHSGDKKEERAERYSVRKLIAFETARELHGELARIPETESARAALFEAIVQLTQGCHAFQSEEKASHFREARRQVATATAHLFLCEEGPAHLMATRLEQELISKIGGLVAVHEKKRKKSSRFDRFGSSKPRSQRG